MAAVKITKDIASVGVLNPNMRIFDVVMKTEYGTSYNAYLVKGSEKTALIETTHRRFFEPFLENIAEAGCDKIDYIVLNHTERRGSISKTSPTGSSAFMRSRTERSCRWATRPCGF